MAKYPGTIIGFSDHRRATGSEYVCPTSVARGARIVEKHYTLNNDLKDHDHNHAITTASLTRLAKNCYEVSLAVDDLDYKRPGSERFSERS
jgi:sialic acid synthase SpsE